MSTDVPQVISKKDILSCSRIKSSFPFKIEGACTSPSFQTFVSFKPASGASGCYVLPCYTIVPILCRTSRPCRKRFTTSSCHAIDYPLIPHYLTESTRESPVGGLVLRPVKRFSSAYRSSGHLLRFQNLCVLFEFGLRTLKNQFINVV